LLQLEWGYYVLLLFANLLSTNQHHDGVLLVASGNVTETQDTDDTQHQEPMKPVGSHGSSTLDKGDGSTLCEEFLLY
jgi:hypothetical protein